jgi:hypothetical protein
MTSPEGVDAALAEVQRQLRKVDRATDRLLWATLVLLVTAVLVVPVALAVLLL